MKPYLGPQAGALARNEGFCLETGLLWLKARGGFDPNQGGFDPNQGGFWGPQKAAGAAPCPAGEAGAGGQALSKHGWDFPSPRLRSGTHNSYHIQALGTPQIQGWGWRFPPLLFPRDETAQIQTLRKVWGWF